MPHPRDNMLEAFRNAGEAPGTSVGGPFVEPAGPSERRLAAADLPIAKLAVVGGAALGLAFVAGVIVGRATADGGEVTLAKEPGASSPGGSALSFPRASGGEASLDPAPGGALRDDPAVRYSDVAALYDPANKYTVVAIAYGLRHEELALDSFEHMRGSDLPAFPPFRSGSNILIVVGAAPVESELRDIERRVEELVGPDGRGHPYTGAYIYPIRPLVGSEPGSIRGD